jgi:hypothetical protein
MRRYLFPLVLLIATLLAAAGCRDDADVSSDEREQAIEAAQQAYTQERARGTDFTNGPCIADEVIDDWSVDIAHDPRTDVDDQPENQCQAYRDGKTHHFVELDPDGKLIRAK